MIRVKRYLSSIFIFTALSACLAACEEGEDLGKDADADAREDDVREQTCPPRPECTEPLVVGEYGIVNDAGCSTYCCVGTEISFENVRIESGMNLTVFASAGASMLGDAHDAYAMGTVSCEIRNPADDSVVGTCGEIELPNEAFSEPFDLEMDCTLSGPQVCDQPVEAVFSYHWHTVQCAADGDVSEIVPTTFLCVY